MTQIEIILLSLLCNKNYYDYEFETVIEQRNMKKNMVRLRGKYILSNMKQK